MAERKLDGIWNAARVLQELLRFTDDRGKVRNLDLSDDSPYGIKVRRFVAAMKAYGKEKCLYLRNEHLISKTCSDEKMKELCLLLKQNLRDEYFTILVNLDSLKGIREREKLMETLFRYRNRTFSY